MTAKRYEFHGDDLVESPDGCWMRAEDYDAALARAEAAALDVLRFKEVAHRRGESLSTQFKRALAAESRLAEATALLDECVKWYRFPERIAARIRAFLSGSTPAPAAEYHAQGNPPPEVLEAARARYAEAYPYMKALADASNAPSHLRPRPPTAPAAEREPVYPPAMHDLLVRNTGLESRIADLEANLAEEVKDRRIAEDDQCTAETRIAQAVAELEKFEEANATQQIDPEGVEHIWSALAILKGTRT